MKSSTQIVTAILITFLSIQLNAQTFIGFRGGVNLAGVNPPNELSGVNSVLEDIISPNFGLVAEFGINENLSFQPELGYTRKGFKIQQGVDIDLFNVPIPIGAKAVTSFDYIEMPLLLKYQFGNSESGIKAHVFGGPNMAFAMKGRLKTKANIIFEIPISNTEINLANNGFQRFEVGGTIGAGMSLPAGAGKLFLDARYTHGFTEIYDVPVVDLKVKNKNFGIQVGYMIPIL